MRRITHRGRVLLPIAVLVLGLSAAAYGHSRAGNVEHFVGVYTLQDESQAKEKVSHAIDEVVHRFGYFKRGIARTKIHDNVYPESPIEIAALPGDRVRFVFDDWRPPPMVIGGDPINTRAPDGETSRMSAHLEENALVLEGRTPRGLKTSTFTLSPDGRHLTLAVRITSEKLPAPIVYRLDYRRVR